MAWAALDPDMVDAMLQDEIREVNPTFPRYDPDISPTRGWYPNEKGGKGPKGPKGVARSGKGQNTDPYREKDATYPRGNGGPVHLILPYVVTQLNEALGEIMKKHNLFIFERDNLDEDYVQQLKGNASVYPFGDGDKTYDGFESKEVTLPNIDTRMDQDSYMIAASKWRRLFRNTVDEELLRKVVVTYRKNTDPEKDGPADYEPKTLKEIRKAIMEVMGFPGHRRRQVPPESKQRSFQSDKYERQSTISTPGATAEHPHDLLYHYGGPLRLDSTETSVMFDKIDVLHFRQDTDHSVFRIPFHCGIPPRLIPRTTEQYWPSESATRSANSGILHPGAEHTAAYGFRTGGGYPDMKLMSDRFMFFATKDGNSRVQVLGVCAMSRFTLPLSDSDEEFPMIDLLCKNVYHPAIYRDELYQDEARVYIGKLMLLHMLLQLYEAGYQDYCVGFLNKMGFEGYDLFESLGFGVPERPSDKKEDTQAVTWTELTKASDPKGIRKKLFYPRPLDHNRDFPTLQYPDNTVRNLQFLDKQYSNLKFRSNRRNSGSPMFMITKRRLAETLCALFQSCKENDFKDFVPDGGPVDLATAEYNVELHPENVTICEEKEAKKKANRKRPVPEAVDRPAAKPKAKPKVAPHIAF